MDHHKKWEWTEYLLSKYNLNRNETLFLGDAITDYKASKFSNLHFALRVNDESIKQFTHIKVNRSTIIMS